MFSLFEITLEGLFSRLGVEGGGGIAGSHGGTVYGTNVNVLTLSSTRIQVK